MLRGWTRQIRGESASTNVVAADQAIIDGSATVLPSSIAVRVQYSTSSIRKYCDALTCSREGLVQIAPELTRKNGRGVKALEALQRVLPVRNRPVQLARNTSEATTRSSQDIPVLLNTRGRW